MDWVRCYTFGWGFSVGCYTFDYSLDYSLGCRYLDNWKCTGGRLG